MPRISRNSVQNHNSLVNPRSTVMDPGEFVQKVEKALRDPYFEHHTAMHFARELVDVFNFDPKPGEGAIKKVRPLIDPSHKCDDCDTMIVAGEPGSGVQFLDMHHDMIRVFKYLLKQEGIVLVDMAGENDKQTSPKDTGEQYRYAPALWDLYDPKQLPLEISSLFSYPEDSDYLRNVFDGVKNLVARAKPGNGDVFKPGGLVDQLGQFIERGIEQDKKEETPKGNGFHNTLHEYLGARERKSAAGAEMNNLRNSRFNDYFWSLHLWIDRQYGRMLAAVGQPFDTSEHAPDDPMQGMRMKTATHKRIRPKMKAPEPDESTLVLSP